MTPAVAILVADVHSFYHRLRRGRRRAALAVTVVALGVGGVAFGGIAFGLGVVAGQVRGPLVDALLISGFSSLGMLMLLVGFSTVVSAFFADRELLLLAVAPLRPSEVFWPRLLGAAWSNAAIGSLLLTMLAGYGVGAGLGPAFDLAAAAVVVLQVTWVTCLQLVILSAVIRVAPVARVRDAANIAAALAAMGFYIAWASYRGPFARGLAQDGGGGLADSTRQLSAFASGLGWLPTAWPAHALATWGTGVSAAWGLVLFAFTAVLVVAGQGLFKASFRTGVGVFGIAAGGSTRRGRPNAPAGRRAGSDISAIVRKDMVTIRRDTRRLVRILPAAALAVLYPFVFGGSTAGAGTGGVYFVVVFIAFLPAQVFGLPAIAHEGRCINLLRLAGLGPVRLMAAKLAGTLIPVGAVTLAGGLSLAMQRHAGPGAAAADVITVLWLGAGCSLLAVGSGALSPRFDANDPRRAVGPLGAIVCALGCLWFGAFSLGAIALAQLAVNGPTGVLAQYLSAATAGFLALVLIAAALAAPVVTSFLGVRSLQRLDFT